MKIWMWAHACLSLCVALIVWSVYMIILAFVILCDIDRNPTGFENTTLRTFRSKRKTFDWQLIKSFWTEFTWDQTASCADLFRRQNSIELLIFILHAIFKKVMSLLSSKHPGSWIFEASVWNECRAYPTIYFTLLCVLVVVIPRSNKFIYGL